MSKKYPTRKDPITGCEVLTTLGFFQKMGDEKGTSAMEEMDSFFQDIAEAEENERQNVIRNALVLLQRLYATEPEAYNEIGIFKPVELIEVYNAQVKSFKESNVRFFAKVKMENEQIVVINYYSYYYSGDFYEPPDGDEDMSIIDFNNRHWTDLTVDEQRRVTSRYYYKKVKGKVIRESTLRLAHYNKNLVMIDKKLKTLKKQ